MSKYTDTELLNALEAEGNGSALLHDFESHWYIVCSEDCTDVVIGGPHGFHAAYLIEDKDVPDARKTAREAIAAWMDRGYVRGYVSASSQG